MTGPIAVGIKKMRVFHCTSCKRKMRIGHFRCDYCESRAPARNWLAIPVAVLLVLYFLYIL